MPDFLQGLSLVGNGLRFGDIARKRSHLNHYSLYLNQSIYMLVMKKKISMSIRVELKIKFNTSHYNFVCFWIDISASDTVDSRLHSSERKSKLPTMVGLGVPQG